VLPRIIKAEARGGHRLWVEFGDGSSGEIDLADELWGEMFEPLKDPAEFSRLSLDSELGTVVWPNGADFAPEFLYQELCPSYRLGQVSDAGAA